MLDLAQPITSPQTILAHLRTGGATDLRATTTHLWVIGYAPRGPRFQLLWWPPHGYCLSQYAVEKGPATYVGVFPTWEAAIDRALQA